MFWPCETRTSTCRNFATISSGLYRFLAIAVLLDVKDIPQVGPLQWGWIKVTGRNGYVQRFRIVWIPTHFGKHRAILVCSSRAGGAIRLHGHYGNYACRFCHRAHYLSQKQKTASRKRLTAAKLRLSVGGLPDSREPLPAKAKWKHRKRHQSICNQIQALEAQANKTRFRKQIDIRTFAYHA